MLIFEVLLNRLRLTIWHRKSLFTHAAAAYNTLSQETCFINTYVIVLEISCDSQLQISSKIVTPSCTNIDFFFVISICWIIAVVIVNLNTSNQRLVSPRRRQNHENAVFFRFLWACCYGTDFQLIKIAIRVNFMLDKNSDEPECFRSYYVNIFRIAILINIHIIIIHHTYNIFHSAFVTSTTIFFLKIRILYWSIEIELIYWNI